MKQVIKTWKPTWTLYNRYFKLLNQ